jgi:hypothetical protein
MVLAYLNRSDFFGEMSLFNSRPRSALVAAREESELAEMHYSKFRQLVLSYPEIVITVSAQMAKPLQKTNAKMIDLARVEVTGRIAHLVRARQAIERHTAFRWHAASHHAPGNREDGRVLARDGGSGAEGLGAARDNYGAGQNYRCIRSEVKHRAASPEYLQATSRCSTRREEFFACAGAIFRSVLNLPIGSR